METETTNEVYDINTETYLLLREEPFFGVVSRFINKTARETRNFHPALDV